MPLLETCNELFGSSDLYVVLDVEKTASQGQIKKAYHKVLCLKWVPGFKAVFFPRVRWKFILTVFRRMSVRFAPRSFRWESFLDSVEQNWSLPWILLLNTLAVSLCSLHSSQWWVKAWTVRWERRGFYHKICLFKKCDLNCTIVCKRWKMSPILCLTPTKIGSTIGVTFSPRWLL